MDRKQGLDSVARRKAAQLIQDFLSGAIVLDELDNTWPAQSDDPAVVAIGELIYVVFCDDLAWFMRRQPPRSGASEEFLERCRLFLFTDRPYEWIGNPLSRSVGARLEDVLSLGLKTTRSEQERKMFEAQGDVDVWPYIRQDDYDSDRSGKPRTESTSS